MRLDLPTATLLCMFAALTVAGLVAYLAKVLRQGLPSMYLWAAAYLLYTIRFAVLLSGQSRYSDQLLTAALGCLWLGARRLVGRPAPAQSAMWSKPSAKASSMVSVPPKRTPPNIANSGRRRRPFPSLQ